MTSPRSRSTATITDSKTPSGQRSRPGFLNLESRGHGADGRHFRTPTGRAERRMWTGSSRPGLLFVLSACRMVSSVLPAAGNQPQAAAAGMTRLWRPGGETVLDAVHAVQQKPQQGQQQNSNNDHDTRPSRLTAPPRVPTTSTASQRDTRGPGNRGGRESKTGDRPNVPRPGDTARHRQGRTLRPPQVSWPFPVRLRTTARPPRAHAHANATSPRPSADGSTGQAASAPARSPPRSSHRPPHAA